MEILEPTETEGGMLINNPARESFQQAEFVSGELLAGPVYFMHLCQPDARRALTLLLRWKPSH